MTNLNFCIQRKTGATFHGICPYFRRVFQCHDLYKSQKVHKYKRGVTTVRIIVEFITLVHILFEHSNKMASLPTTNNGKRSAPNSSNTSRRRKTKDAVRISMCFIFLFVWPIYRAPTIETTINENKDRDAFLPRNLDSPKHVPCGQYKCFFHNKYNHDIGYLVAPSTRKKNTNFQWFETLESGWTLAEQLKKDFEIKHFLLAPPIKVKVSKDLDKKLNKRLFSEKTQRLIRGKSSTRYPKGSTVFVQECTTAPKKNVVLGCNGSKMPTFKKLFDGFTKGIRYTDSFRQNFKHGLNQTKLVLQSEPCLTKDFQVIVDEKVRVAMSNAWRANVGL